MGIKLLRGFQFAVLIMLPMFGYMYHKVVLTVNYSRHPLHWKDEIKRGMNYSQNDTLEQIIMELRVHKANTKRLVKFIDEVNRTRGFMGHDLRPINPHPFKYIINNKSICKGRNIFVICYVHTAPSHFKRRAIIRETWGNPIYYTNVLIQVVFFVGKTSHMPEIQEKLEYESDRYNDIIQEDFEDDYHNLTHKTVGALKWISLNCRNAKYVLKADDDAFINMFSLLKMLQKIDFEGRNRGVLLCFVLRGSRTIRVGKWKVTKEEYGDKVYPQYCPGLAYTMSTDVALALHQASYYVPFLWVDDVFITGLLTLKLGIDIQSIRSNYLLNGNQFVAKFTGIQGNKLIFCEVTDLIKFQSVWKTIVNRYHGSDLSNMVKMYSNNTGRPYRLMRNMTPR